MTSKINPVYVSERIEHIECFAAHLPLRKPLRMSSHTIAHGPVLFVRVISATGIEGWGEAGVDPTMNGETLRGMCAIIEENLTQLIVGLDAMDRVAIARSFKSLYANGSAKTALDMALVDLVGHSRGIRAVDVLGGAARSSAMVLRLIGGSLDSELDAEEARKLRDEGFGAFKLKVGVMAIEKEAETLRLIREQLGTGVQLSADANMAWDVDTARRFASLISDFSITYIEQPVVAGDVARMRRVAESTNIAICADESIHGIGDVLSLNGAGAIGGVSLKTVKLGGLTNLCQTAVIVDAIGLSMNLAMLVESSVASAAMAHAACSIPQINWGVSLGSLLITDQPARSDISVVDGQVLLGNKPGLGIEIAVSELARFSPSNKTISI
jgi:muconate cycloisomerase